MSRPRLAVRLSREEQERHEGGHCTNKRNGVFCTNYTGGANGSPFGHCEDCDDDAARKSPVAYARAARRAAAPEYYEGT